MSSVEEKTGTEGDSLSECFWPTALVDDCMVGDLQSTASVEGSAGADDEALADFFCMTDEDDVSDWWFLWDALDEANAEAKTNRFAPWAKNTEAVHDPLIVTSLSADDDGVRVRLSPAGLLHVREHGQIDSLIIGSDYLAAAAGTSQPSAMDTDGCSIEIAGAASFKAKGHALLIRGIRSDFECVVTGLFDNHEIVDRKATERI